jgi:transcriptional regulator of acetoin/glycerol metabolism
MPAPIQAALLRALQEREVLPVGATRTVPVDARVVAATHQDLEARVAAGDFREDLFARIAGFVFRIPPLRERREDFGLLVASVLRRVVPCGSSVSIDVAAGALLLRHTWPRNVREVEKALAAAVATAQGGSIEPRHLPVSIRGSGARELRGDVIDAERLGELLAAHEGNVHAVASALATSRSQIHRLAKRLGVELDAYRTKRPRLSS